MTAYRDPHVTAWVTDRLTGALAGQVPADRMPQVVDTILEAFPHLRLEQLRELGPPVGVLSLSARVEMRWRDCQWVEYRAGEYEADL